MLSVDEGRRTAGLLRVGHDMQHERRFAGRLRPVNLDDPSARHATHPERNVQAKRAGGDRVNLQVRPLVTEPHDRAFAKTLGDGGDGGLEVSGAFVQSGGFGGCFCGHFRLSDGRIGYWIKGKKSILPTWPLLRYTLPKRSWEHLILTSP